MVPTTDQFLAILQAVNGANRGGRESGRETDFFGNLKGDVFFAIALAPLRPIALLLSISSVAYKNQ
jgi:hypothetical protein